MVNCLPLTPGVRLCAVPQERNLGLTGRPPLGGKILRNARSSRGRRRGTEHGDPDQELTQHLSA